MMIAITGLLARFAWRNERWRPVAVGWLWFVGTLAPVIGIVQSGNQSRADRFTYFPAIGLSLALVWLWPTQWTVRHWQRMLSATVAIAIVSILTACMTLQLMLWRDPLSLYLSGLSHTRDNWFLASIAAYEYQQRGDFDHAIAYYETVVRLAPYMQEPENNLAGLLFKCGRPEEALVHMRRAHELAPDNPVYSSNYNKIKEYLAVHAAAQPSR